jgi:hypothetical protein
MGRRNRDAVRELRENEGLPTFYQVERPVYAAQREHEEQQRIRREEAERHRRTGATLLWVAAQNRRRRGPLPRGSVWIPIGSAQIPT